ncbi:MAG: PmoA family protein [Planctomycetaceae bacterium]|nr:PmoA family protein [Planctomycetaceae bacterium]
MATPPARCQVIPQAGRQVSFCVDDREVLRWHEGLDYPRPYFFPLVAPSGRSLTRMGHPGAPNHDHHQSIWFAHHKVMGIDFWGNASGATIRQLQWLAYEDGDDACRMAVLLGWYDGHDPAALMQQEMVCEVRPVGSEREFVVEVQSRFTPSADSLELQQTNFGVLAVRVARGISGHFGGGTLTNSESAIGERAIFGKPATWVDYSGATDRNAQQIEGITYMDHPSNPGQPTGWHVREDGWMCASPTMNASIVIEKSQPLILRYQLFVHSGGVAPDRIAELAKTFDGSSGWVVSKSKRPHIAWTIDRMEAK